MPHFAAYICLIDIAVAKDNLSSRGQVSEICSGTSHCNRHYQSDICELEDYNRKQSVRI